MYTCSYYKSFQDVYTRQVLRNGIGSRILELSAGLIVLLFNIALLRVSGEAAVAIFSVLSNIAYVLSLIHICPWTPPCPRAPAGS